MEDELENGGEYEGTTRSWRYILAVSFIIIILVGAGLIYLNRPHAETKQESENLSIYYLMPLDCEDCDLSMINEISSELKIEIKSIRTKIVPRPNVLIIFGDRADLGLANSKLNTLSLLCEFANITKACELRDGLRDIEFAVDCLNGYNVSSDSVIFYTGEDCDHCSEMKPWIRQLGKENYTFYTIDLVDENRTRIADECLSEILDLSGDIPQFACPALGRSHMGAFTSIGEMREFAENCRNA